MTIEHSVITDPNIHEPKGVSTANSEQVYSADGVGSGSWVDNYPKGVGSATEDQVLIANGAGGAAWGYMGHGWGYYQDAATTPATLSITTTPSVIQIDGGGSANNTSYLPREIRGSGQLWDTTNDLITPIRVGDAYDIRLDLTVSGSTGAPTYLELQLDIGGTSSPTNVIASRAITVYKTPPFDISIGFPIFCLTTFVTNGGQLFLNTDTGTATISNRAILISRNFDGNY